MNLQSPANVRYKTVLCRHFMNGFCQAGASCQFAHGEHEKRSINDPLPANVPPIPVQSPPTQPTQPVQYPPMQMNLFQMPTPQQLSLKTQLCKYFQNGYCKNQNCPFAHGLNELQTAQTALTMQAMARQSMFMAPQPQMMPFPIPNLLVGLQQQNITQYITPPNMSNISNIPQYTPIQYQQLGKPDKKELLKQLMLDIVQKLEEVFKNSQVVLYQLRVAKEGLKNYNFAICSEMLKLIVSDPTRTEEELERYEKIYNEAQEIIKKNDLE